MKKYEKPTLEVVQIKVREDFANNTTIYHLGNNNAQSDGYLPFGGQVS